jgi:hypothetical protein
MEVRCCISLIYNLTVLSRPYQPLFSMCFSRLALMKPAQDATKRAVKRRTNLIYLPRDGSEKAGGKQKSPVAIDNRARRRRLLASTRLKLLECQPLHMLAQALQTEVVLVLLFPLVGIGLHGFHHDAVLL